MDPYSSASTCVFDVGRCVDMLEKDHSCGTVQMISDSGALMLNLKVNGNDRHAGELLGRTPEEISEGGQDA